MGILQIILVVIFVIIALLLVLLVLVQDDSGDAMGGILGGGSSSAFGSRSGNILTRATSILGFLFIGLAFGMIFLFKSPDVDNVLREGVSGGEALEEVSELFGENEEPEEEAIDFSDPESDATLEE